MRLLQSTPILEKLFFLLIIISSPIADSLLHGQVSGSIEGLSMERLERITQVMEQAVEQERIPGAVMLISRRGKIVYEQAIGMADRQGQDKMNGQTMFQIASMSKPVASVAAMMLYERGRFLLNDPIEDYIPAFKGVKVCEKKEDGTYSLVEPKNKITIRHLLNFTSGITAGGGLPSTLLEQIDAEPGWHAGSRILGPRVAEIAKFPLVSHPGMEFHYSNATDILGYLVEVITGMSFDEFLQNEVFAPLKMNDSHFIVPKQKLKHIARMCGSNPDGTIRHIDFDREELTHRTYFSGGAGLISTARDYHRFAQMILNKGQVDGVRLLSTKTVELMTSNSIGDLYSAFRYNSGDKFGYGFGIRTERGQYDELESLGIIGWDGAYYTRFWIDPEEELIGIFMSQVSGKWTVDPRVIAQFRVLVYAAVVD